MLVDTAPEAVTAALPVLSSGAGGGRGGAGVRGVDRRTR